METKYLRRDEVAVLLSAENSDHYYTSRIRTAKGYNLFEVTLIKTKILHP